MSRAEGIRRVVGVLALSSAAVAVGAGLNAPRVDAAVPDASPAIEQSTTESGNQKAPNGDLGLVVFMGVVAAVVITNSRRLISLHNNRAGMR